jgi:hypothetical protein
VTTAYDDDDAIEAEVVEQTARIVQLRKTLPPPLALEAATEPEPASRARDLVKRVARPLPGPKRMGRVTLWWTLHLAMVLPWLPKLAFQELWPIGRGVRIVCSGWANWAQATRRHEYAKEAEGNTKTKYGTAAEKTAVARKWGSAAFAAILAGVGVWLWNTHPGYLLVAGILALAGLDLLGRADTPVQKSAPAMPRVLSENVPLRQVEASVLAALEREGFPEGSVGWRSRCGGTKHDANTRSACRWPTSCGPSICGRWSGRSGRGITPSATWPPTPPPSAGWSSSSATPSPRCRSARSSPPAPAPSCSPSSSASP